MLDRNVAVQATAVEQRPQRMHHRIKQGDGTVQFHVILRWKVRQSSLCLPIEIRDFTCGLEGAR
uniref:Uncharacterized protein n=1 Tax=Magnetospirillum gryphiswaldense TaxID=55518 RepID=A4TTL4_9PROT|nr:hypothetical protein MGR_0993 [Magnetospirillum gryphiswaldense MSR-1]